MPAQPFSFMLFTSFMFLLFFLLNQFKEQLYEFVKYVEEPFDINFLMYNCNQPINRERFYDILYELEEEGKILVLQDGRYLSLYTLKRKWIKIRLVNIPIPKELYNIMIHLIHKGIFKNVEDIIREAIKRYKSRGGNLLSSET